jgi:type I restriction enzyme S subunit
MVKLGEVVTQALRGTEPMPGTAYRQIGVKLWGEGAYERETIDGSQTKYAQLFRAETGDIIVNKIWARNGSVAVVPEALDGCFGSGEFPMFTPDPAKLDSRWMHWITKTRDFWEQCDEKSRGTSGKNRIKPHQFLSVEIPLPPLAEQRRIVARIEQLAEQIHEAKRLRKEAAEEAEAMMASEANAIFTSDMAHTWKRLILDDIADIRAGVTLGRRLTGDTILLPYLRVANVQDGYLDLTEIKEVEVYVSEAEKWSLQSGDILLTEGGDWDKLGRGTIWRNEIENCIHQNHVFRVRALVKTVTPEFLAKQISSPVGKAYFQSASKQTTNLASINQRQLKAFPVLCPPLPEQRRIVAELDALQAEVDGLKRLQAETSAELDGLLPAILDRAFKGEL